MDTRSDGLTPKKEGRFSNSAAQLESLVRYIAAVLTIRGNTARKFKVKPNTREFNQTNCRDISYLEA
jgi:hypothetical protein